MYRSIVSLLLIGSLLILPASRSVLAQASMTPEEVGVTGNQSPPAVDMRKAIAENDLKHRERAGKTDAKTMERLDRQQAQRQGLTGKQKFFIVLGVAAFAALIVLLIKYGKDCKTSDPPNCTVGVDEFCTCTEYEQESRFGR